MRREWASRPNVERLSRLTVNNRAIVRADGIRVSSENVVREARVELVCQPGAAKRVDPVL